MQQKKEASGKEKEVELVRLSSSLPPFQPSSGYKRLRASPSPTSYMITATFLLSRRAFGKSDRTERRSRFLFVELNSVDRPSLLSFPPPATLHRRG